VKCGFSHRNRRAANQTESLIPVVKKSSLNVIAHLAAHACELLEHAAPGDAAGAV
jgi:hypothetical protein